MCKQEDVESIAAEIMSYLHRRPMASDSLDGITHWWLVQQTLEKKVSLVEQALELLVLEGKVNKKMYNGRETIYSLGSEETQKRND